MQATARRSLGICAIFCVFTATADAAYPTLNRSVSIDSGYLESMHSNRAYAAFGSEVLGLLNMPFDGVASLSFVAQNMPLRLGWAGANAALVYFVRHPHIETQLFLSLHEVGHGLRMSAAGANPFYGFFSSPQTYDNYFSYLIAAIARQENGGYTSAVGRTNVNISNTTIDAGGINNSQYVGHFLEEQAYDEGGHFLNFYYYYSTKTDAARYVDIVTSGASSLAGTGDVGAIAAAYQAQGYNIQLNDLRTASYLSLAASSHTYAYIWGLVKYILSGDPRVRSFEVGPLRIPDVDVYFNETGISAKVKSGLRFGTLRFPFAVEYQYMGAKRVEFNVGIRNEWPQKPLRSLSANVVVGSGVGGEVAAQLRLGQLLGIEAGLAMRDFHTLDGQRLSTNGNSTWGFDVWGRLSLYYF